MTMRLPLIAFLLLLALATGAQTPADTTIYEVAEIMPYPLLKKCKPELHPGWTQDSIRHCAESQLLALLAQNMRYPEDARTKNISGVVVTTFVVEPDGKMHYIGILKDIGGGCGDEALRVLKALDEFGLRWQPGMRDGKPVRMKTVLPIRFRLEEALPYYLGEAGDTIYTIIDTLPTFRGGLDSLARFVINRLEYPQAYADSCKTGIIEMSLLIRATGVVKVENTLDFNNLGLDFQWQAIRMANRSSGQWQPATYQGKPVNTTYPLRAIFKSDQPGCRSANERFDKAMILADEGAALLEKEQKEAAVAKWTAALALHPDNTEVLYYRGSALLSLNRRDEACQDFNRVKSLLGVTWFEGIRRVMCGW